MTSYCKDDAQKYVASFPLGMDCLVTADGMVKCEGVAIMDLTGQIHVTKHAQTNTSAELLQDEVVAPTFINDSVISVSGREISLTDNRWHEAVLEYDLKMRERIQAVKTPRKQLIYARLFTRKMATFLQRALRLAYPGYSPFSPEHVSL